MHPADRRPGIETHHQAPSRRQHRGIHTQSGWQYPLELLDGNGPGRFFRSNSNKRPMIWKPSGSDEKSKTICFLDQRGKGKVGRHPRQSGGDRIEFESDTQPSSGSWSTCLRVAIFMRLCKAVRVHPPDLLERIMRLSHSRCLGAAICCHSIEATRFDLMTFWSRTQEMDCALGQSNGIRVRNALWLRTDSDLVMNWPRTVSGDCSAPKLPQIADGISSPSG